MMKLKALVSFACVGLSAAPGREFSCPEELAADLLQAGFAEEVKNEDQRSDDGAPVSAAAGKRRGAKSK